MALSLKQLQQRNKMRKIPPAPEAAGVNVRPWENIEDAYPAVSAVPTSNAAPALLDIAPNIPPALPSDDLPSLSKEPAPVEPTCDIQAEPRVDQGTKIRRTGVQKPAKKIEEKKVTGAKPGYKNRHDQGTKIGVVHQLVPESVAPELSELTEVSKADSRGRPKLQPNTLIYRVLLHLAGAEGATTSSSVATTLSASQNSVKICIKRLRKMGLLDSDNRNRAGGLYRLTRFGVAFSNESKDQKAPKREVPSAPEPITGTERHVADLLQECVDRLGLDRDLRIGANDLFSVWRSSSEPFDDFLLSIEHLVFYLRSKEAESIKSPKAWMLKQLRHGYYAAPAGFVSHQERVIEAKNRDRQTQLQRVFEAKRREFELEFELWLNEQDPSSLKRRLPPPLDNPQSPAAKAALREVFCRETNRALPTEM